MVGFLSDDELGSEFLSSGNVYNCELPMLSSFNCDFGNLSYL